MPCIFIYYFYQWHSNCVLQINQQNKTQIHQGFFIGSSTKPKWMCSVMNTLKVYLKETDKWFFPQGWNWRRKVISPRAPYISRCSTKQQDYYAYINNKFNVAFYHLKTPSRFNFYAQLCHAWIYFWCLVHTLKKIRYFAKCSENVFQYRVINRQSTGLLLSYFGTINAYNVCFPPIIIT